MKIQQMLKTAFAALALSFSVEVSQAAGPGDLICYIYLAGPCHNNRGVLPNRWFADGDPGGLLTSYSALNATSPLGREINTIFAYSNI